MEGQSVCGCHLFDPRRKHRAGWHELREQHRLAASFATQFGRVHQLSRPLHQRASGSFRKNKIHQRCDYTDLQFAKPRPSDNLVYDGWFRGEVRNEDFLQGNGIGKGFGKDKGDWVSYSIQTNENEGILTLRYRLKENTQNALVASGLVNETIQLKATGKFELVQVPFSSATNQSELKLTATGGGEIELDGLFIGPESDSKAIQIKSLEKKFTPEFTKNLEAGTVFMKYPDVDNFYGMAWDFPSSFVREILDEELDVIFKKYVHEHNYLVFEGDEKGHYLNVFMRPVELEPMSNHTVYSIVCTGNKTQVRKPVEPVQQKSIGLHFKRKKGRKPVCQAIWNRANPFNSAKT
jgi:hypothetical protein